MIALTVTPNVEEAPWADLAGQIFNDGEMATIERIGLLPRGMGSGRPSVSIVVRLPGGQVVLAETSWRNFHLAARALAVSPIAQEWADE